MTSPGLETYRSLAEASPEAIFLVDLETARITEVNERTRELFGYDGSELVGVPVTEVHPSEKMDQYREMFERSTESETICFDTLPDGSQVVVETADGERIPVEIHAKRVAIDGTPHVFSSVRDVSNRVEQTERLEQTTDELAVLNRLVRHDIRNDMGIILGWAAQLRGADPEDYDEIIERIESHGEHVVSLTDLARDYVEIITGDAEMDLEPTDLETVLGDEVTATRESYPEADVGYTEGSETDYEVLATPLLESVFRNLLVNAIQHNDTETPRVRVDIDVTAETVTVCIADDGPGIPDAKKETVFGRGEQGLDSSGTGIGLYLVDRLVGQFGGSVHVKDRNPEAFPLPGDGDRPAGDPDGSVFVVELQRASI